MNAADLRPSHLLTFSALRHPMQAVQRCFTWAAQVAELLSRNPFDKVKLPPQGRRSRIMDAKQRAQVLRAAKREFRRFLIAMRETLARPQEVRAFDWSHIRPMRIEGSVRESVLAGHAAFILTEFKGRKRRKDGSAVRVIPITRRLGRLLYRLAGAAELPRAGLIFTGAAGQAWTRNALRLRMRKVRKQLQIGADLFGESIVCYTFRHTGATEACALGIRDRVLADLLGHSSTAMTMRYQHLQPEHLMDAMEELQRRKQGDNRRAG